MIVDLLLLVLQGALSILLLPLTVVNIVIDFVSGITVFVSFLQVIAYILPWSNILPLIVLTIGLIGLRIGIAIVKTIWDLLPFV
jgi:hypothetical protein